MAALQELNRAYDKYFAAVGGTTAPSSSFIGPGYPARTLVCDHPLGEFQKVDTSRPASMAPSVRTLSRARPLTTGLDGVAVSTAACGGRGLRVASDAAKRPDFPFDGDQKPGRIRMPHSRGMPHHQCALHDYRHSCGFIPPPRRLYPSLRSG